MTTTQKTIFKSLGFFLIGFIVLYLVYQNQNAQHLAELAAQDLPTTGQSLLKKIFRDFTTVRLEILAVVLICFMISNISRALRWQMLLEPMGKKPSLFNALASIMVAYMVNLGIPRSGEFVRAGLLSRYEGIPPEKVMGTIVTDRIIDVLSLLFVITLALVFSFSDMYGYFMQNARLSGEDGGFQLSSGWILLIAALGIGSVAMVILKREFIVQSSLGKRMIKIISGFVEGLKTVFQLKNPLLFIFHSLVIWLMYYLMTYLSFFAFAPTAHLSPLAGLVVFVFGTLGFVFPAPGGIGSYQYLVAESLSSFYGVGIGDASSFANIVFFAVTIFCNIFFGIISFILLPVYNAKSKTEKFEESSEP